MTTYQEHNRKLEERISLYRMRSQENYVATGEIILQQTKKGRGEIKSLTIAIEMSEEELAEKVKEGMTSKKTKVYKTKVYSGLSPYTLKEILKALGSATGVYYALKGQAQTIQYRGARL